MSTIKVQVCESNFDWSTKILSSTGKGYYVLTWGPTTTGVTRHGWHCSCPGFTYRGSCKHTRIGDGQICHWGSGGLSGSPEEPNEDGTCPDCGSDTRTVEVSV